VRKRQPDAAHAGWSYSILGGSKKLGGQWSARLAGLFHAKKWAKVINCSTAPRCESMTNS
jgi:hypothetical protein